VIQIGAGGGAVLAIGLAVLFRAAAIPAPHVLFWLGIILVVASGLLRAHCFRMLGDQFTSVVHVTQEQRVVQRGVYRWVRHPAYTAGAMSLVGIGLVLANWASLVTLVLVCVIIYAYRVHVEEQALIATLGAAYQEYRRHTKMFIPFLF
jgi:protein-S-isoprenylcysteine O-methyltransferase Ste14